MASMTGFTCQNLVADQVYAVFPLVREVVSGLDLKSWSRMARRLVNARRATHEGIRVILRLPRRLPCGLFLYHREIDLVHGPILVAEHLIAVDVLDPDTVMQALIADLEALAERLGCTATRTMVFGQVTLAASGLYAAGHRPEGAALWKPLEDPPRPPKEIARH